MISRRVATRAGALARMHRATLQSSVAVQRRWQSQADIEDPNMNGGYVNPPPIKRQFRDPYGDWWDKQDRRNYGEPVHEDNDIMGVFATEEYTHMPMWKAWTFNGIFVLFIGSVAGAVYLTYDGKPSAPRTFPGGLEAELGGPKAPRVLKDGEI